MGAIWANRTRQRQPQTAAPLSTRYGRVLHWQSGHLSGVARSAAPGTSAQDVIATPQGIGLASSAAVKGSRFGATDGIGSGSLTLVALLRINSATPSGATAGVFGNWSNTSTASSVQITVVGGGTTSLRIQVNRGGGSNFVDSANLATGAPHVLIGRVSVTGAFDWWINGAQIGSSSTPTGALTEAGQYWQVGTYYSNDYERTSNVTTILSAAVDGYLPIGEIPALSANPWQLFAPQRTARIYSFPTGATNYSVTATDALTLADSASNVASLGAAGSDALTLADSASNVAALSATATDALSLADSASNVAALSATASDAMTLADTLNATASGDYTAIGSDALTLADSATNVASLGATGSDALTLADAASNAAVLGAAASDALTLADTLNASASGDYVVTATDALSLSDSVVAAYAAICIATDALTLADATSAGMSGMFSATAGDALALADAMSNVAALGGAISESLALMEMVSAMIPGAIGDPTMFSRAAGPMIVRVKGFQ